MEREREVVNEEGEVGGEGEGERGRRRGRGERGRRRGRGRER